MAAKRVVHIGDYERVIRGGRIFVYAFTLCRGEVGLKTTGDVGKADCKRCLAKRKKAANG